MKTITYQIAGVAPILLHNVRLADPTCDVVKQIKKITSKKTKTEADHEELSRLEWYGSLYLDEHENIIIPSENLESMLVAASKANKLSKLFQSGVFIEQDAILDYGKRLTPDELWNSRKYINKSSVKVQKNRVLRTRPMFPVWQLEFTVTYSPEVVTKAQLDDALDIAGNLVGLGDWRPKFGRFEVVK
jgi:hypothetical protein